ncbi:MutS-related protein [Aureivirga sp. CE67]|uniref:MutS-related protein n=1 Tax=Aureivirga sp. CE67 TaxID=1788983 RepID=UPI0018C9E2B5|nr:DNA mismatch repair protein MutS [Aureivirga sp. CE67]
MKYENPALFYEEQKQRAITIQQELKKKLIYSSIIRFTVFLLTVFSLYYYFGEAKFMIGSLVIGISLFLFLVSKHTDLQRKRDVINSKIAINDLELKVLNKEKVDLDTGEEFINPRHFFSYDIDLFGRGSFFQFLNRTATLSGKKKLASVLTENHIDHIEKKQKAIQELAEKAEWRQDFTAKAQQVKTETKEEKILELLNSHVSFIPKSFKAISIGFSVISFLMIAGIFFELIPSWLIMIWFFLGLGITGRFVKKIGDLYANVSRMKSNFQQYHLLLDMIENTSFETEILKEQHQLIRTENLKASEVLKEFSKAIDALDQRNNIFFGIIGNGLFLWDIQQILKIEKWISEYHGLVENWFSVLAFFDAENSLANYAFNHPKYTFSKIENNGTVIESKELGHPLLDEKVRIDNNYTIHSKEFFIITGANMAGKSTFLRTVSLSIVMSNIGLPVCAKSFSYSPIKLITSMRTSDSLADDSSYFFSELTRLKFIVEEMKNDRYFIILDEILKGTNSKDKAEGSQKFVTKLVHSGSTGIIATHDLSLCRMEDEFKQVKNFYFDAEIINDELHFDYHFKTGVCKNMNASFLLKKMEIV